MEHPFVRNFEYELMTDRDRYASFFARADDSEAAGMMILFTVRRIYLMTITRPPGRLPATMQIAVERLANKQENAFLISCEWLRETKAFQGLPLAERRRIEAELLSISFEPSPH